MALSAEELADLRRWAISAAIVVLAHGAIAARIVPWREEIEPAEPAAAIVVEFAPIPVAPPTAPTEIAPGPEQVVSPASPETPAEHDDDAKKIDEEDAWNTIEEPERRQQEVAKLLPQEPRTPAPTTSAPQAIPAQSAAVPAAPMQGRLTPAPSNTVPTWKMHILALLERNKRYPEAAQSRRQEGVAQVFFSIDRQGHVINSRLVRSSGASTLDDEALALLRRAEPFPPPPPELPGGRVDLTVPIRFNLK